MKSMKPSPDFGTPCSGQSVNWNCRTVRDWPSWNEVSDRVAGFPPAGLPCPIPPPALGARCPTASKDADAALLAIRRPPDDVLSYVTARQSTAPVPSAQPKWHPRPPLAAAPWCTRHLPPPVPAAASVLYGASPPFATQHRATVRPTLPRVCPLKSITRHHHPTSCHPGLVTPHPWPPPPLPCTFSARPSPQLSSRASQHRPSLLASSHGDPMALFPTGHHPRAPSSADLLRLSLAICAPDHVLSPKGCRPARPDPDGLRSHLPRSCTVSGRGGVGQPASIILRDPTSFSTVSSTPAGPRLALLPASLPTAWLRTAPPRPTGGTPFWDLRSLSNPPASHPTPSELVSLRHVPQPHPRVLQPHVPPIPRHRLAPPKCHGPTTPAAHWALPPTGKVGTDLHHHPPPPPRRNPPSPHRAPCLCQSLRVSTGLYGPPASPASPRHSYPPTPPPGAVLRPSPAGHDPLLVWGSPAHRPAPSRLSHHAGSTATPSSKGSSLLSPPYTIPLGPAPW